MGRATDTSEPEPRRRVGAIVAVAVGSLLSLAAVSVAVVTTSVAAFSDATSTGASSFSAGSVELIDDDNDLVMFNAAGLVPGQAVTRCIRATYQGSVTDPGAVRLYSGGYTDSSTLATWLRVSVEEGDGGTFSDCTGFAPDATTVSGVTLAAFDGARTDYASGAGSWDPVGSPESKTYRVTIALDGAAPNSLQGESVSDVAFIWEVQS